MALFRRSQTERSQQRHNSRASRLLLGSPAVRQVVSSILCSPSVRFCAICANVQALTVRQGHVHVPALCGNLLRTLGLCLFLLDCWVCLAPAVRGASRTRGGSARTARARSVALLLVAVPRTRIVGGPLPSPARPAQLRGAGTLVGFACPVLEPARREAGTPRGQSARLTRELISHTGWSPRCRTGTACSTHVLYEPPQGCERAPVHRAGCRRRLLL